MSIILITGSSTGIGYATAETLARNGHTVYATMRSPQSAPQLQQMADANHLPINILAMDVLDDQSVQNAISVVLSKEKHIDVLVNNAGIGSWGAVDELSMELFKADMETNFFGTLRCTKAVLPAMHERKSGTVINVTSAAGKVYMNFFASYCASKAAIEAFSESLAQELQPFNIRVAIVEPGVVSTPIFSKGNIISEDTNYSNIKRFFSFFAASLEFHTPPSVVAEVISEIVSGKRTMFRNPAGPDATPMLQMRASLSDEDWINSVAVSDEDWINGMEQMGLQVRKYMQARGLPRFGTQDV
ncbi:MAG TPA: SDR family oxidoreductase [Chitinophagaceae bacterium]|nr:SDR family oxidoreductase [Chitinophagaceae bacterium]